MKNSMRPLKIASTTLATLILSNTNAVLGENLIPVLISPTYKQYMIPSTYKRINKEIVDVKVLQVDVRNKKQNFWYRAKCNTGKITSWESRFFLWNINIASLNRHFFPRYEYPIPGTNSDLIYKWLCSQPR